MAQRIELNLHHLLGREFRRRRQVDTEVQFIPGDLGVGHRSDGQQAGHGDHPSGEIVNFARSHVANPAFLVNALSNTRETSALSNRVALLAFHSLTAAVPYIFSTLGPVR